MGQTNVIMKRSQAVLSLLLAVLQLFLIGCGIRDANGPSDRETASSVISPEETAAPLPTEEDTTVPAEETDVTAPEESETAQGKTPAASLLSSCEPFGTIGMTNLADAKIREKLSALEATLLATDTAVFYESLSDHAVFAFRAEQPFRCQSTIKAPYCLSVMRMLGSMEALESREICLSEEQITPGFGPTSLFPPGTLFSPAELICNTIRDSDNTAYRMLFDTYGKEAFNLFSDSCGSGCRLVGDRFCSCSVSDMAALFRAIYEDNTAMGPILLEHMENTSAAFLTNAALPEYRIAHKYGLDDEMGDCHDCAIVYDDVPFLLVIFSHYDPASSSPFASFRSIARTCAEIHESIYS